MPETTRKHVYLFKDNLIRVVFVLTLSIIVVGFAFLDEPQSSQGKSQSKGTQATKDVKAEKTLWEGFSSDATAVLTFGLFIVGTAQAGLFVWQLSLIRKSLIDTKKAAKAAKRQAKLARDTLIAGQRAWIKVGTPEDRHNLRARGPGLILDLPIPIQNIGNIPAIDISVVAWIDFTWINEKNRDNYAERFESERVKTSYLSPTLFPEKSDNNFDSIICSVRAKWDDMRPHITSAGDFEIVVPALIGCVSYGFPTDTNMRHQTRFAFYMHTGAAVVVEQSRDYESVGFKPFYAPGAFHAD